MIDFTAEPEMKRQASSTAAKPEVSRLPTSKAKIPSSQKSDRKSGRCDVRHNVVWR
jgi:hypothetical protein